MSIRKRLVALAAAGAAALLVGGGLSALHTAPAVFAATPTTGAVGCANSTDPTTINFTTNPATGQMTSQTQNTVVVGGATIAPGALSLAVPLGQVLCGVVLQDADGTPNTVDSGSITARVTGPTQITESNAATFSWLCGPAATVDGCPGAMPNAAATLVAPLPGNTFHVGLLTGASFGLVGTATPTIAVSATWTGNVGAAPFPTFTTPTALIVVAAPAYSIVLAANPGTIPANIPTSTSAQGSVITATMYHVATGTVCVPITAGATTLACSLTGGAGIVAGAPIVAVVGAESGTIEFSTSLGDFAAAGPTPAGPTLVSVTGAAQTIAVHCGAVPNTFPTTLIPTPGLITALGVSSCQTASATLVGGGEAGTAIVVGNFVGDFTGATAQGETTVNLTPGPITTALTTGCNEVITPANLAAGSNGAAVAALATNFNVQSIWVFNNATHSFQALYFATAGAPTDISSVGPNQSVFVCGTGAGTFRVA